MSPMMASVQPDTNPCPAASDAARPAVGETLKLNRIRPSGPRTPPPCSPAAPLKRDRRLSQPPTNSTPRPTPPTWLHEAHQTALQLGGVVLELGLAHIVGKLGTGRRAREHGVESLVERGE